LIKIAYLKKIVGQISVCIYFQKYGVKVGFTASIPTLITMT